MSVLTDRFWTKVRDDHGCWTWTGAVGSTGYGQWGVNGKPKSVHRLAWTEFRGGIPDGLTVDHLCRNKRCVNPWHMDLVTAAVNNQRRFQYPDSCLLPVSAPWNAVESLEDRERRERNKAAGEAMSRILDDFLARIAA